MYARINMSSPFFHNDLVKFRPEAPGWHFRYPHDVRRRIAASRAIFGPEKMSILSIAEHLILECPVIFGLSYCWTSPTVT